MGIAANTHSMDIVETSVDIEKIMVADPLRRIGEIKVDIHFPSTKTYTDKEKKILERAALTCPVYLSLNENVQKTVTFNWP
jgi:uncharacterized OsmC-like protein